MKPLFHVDHKELVTDMKHKLRKHEPNARPCRQT